MVHLMPVVYYVFAAILLGGGAMGSYVSQKPSSLLGSAAFAAVSVVAGVLTGRNAATGITVGLVNAIAVAGFFVYRYLETRKAMPAAPSILLSLAVIAMSLLALAAARRAPGG